MTKTRASLTCLLLLLTITATAQQPPVVKNAAGPKPPATKPTPAAQQPALTPQPAKPIQLGERRSLRSSVLNEERPYLVYLPASYANAMFAPKRYPVLYLLDGDMHFQSASGVVQFMSEGINANIQIPELIIVAIPNTNRARDLSPTHSTKTLDGTERADFQDSGGGEAFIKFLTSELIPHIESSYRTLPYRIIVGHSLGGLTALDALVRTPSTFRGYIAIDPAVWWDGEVLLRQAKQQVPKEVAHPASVYIAVANTPRVGTLNPELGQAASRRFGRFLQTKATSLLRSKVQTFKDEDHSSVPLISLYHGLLFLFEGYKPSVSTMFGDPSAIQEHFKNASKRIGFEILPPEEVVNLLGYALIGMGQPEDKKKAIEFFKLNVANYPSSFNAHDSLGEAYALGSQRDLAIASYEKSVQLNPKHENGKQALEKLKAQAQH